MTTPTPEIQTNSGRRLRALLERQKSAWAVLGDFSDTPKTFAAFRDHFGRLSKSDRMFMVVFYQCASEERALGKICSFWNINDYPHDMGTTQIARP